MIEEKTVCVVSVSNMIEEQTVKPFVTILYDDRLQYYIIHYITNILCKYHIIYYNMILSLSIFKRLIVALSIQILLFIAEIRLYCTLIIHM